MILCNKTLNFTINEIIISALKKIFENFAETNKKPPKSAV